MIFLVDCSWRWTRPKDFQGKSIFQIDCKRPAPWKKIRRLLSYACKTKPRRSALHYHSIICNWRSKKNCPTSRHLATSNFVYAAFSCKSCAGEMKIADFHGRFMAFLAGCSWLQRCVLLQKSLMAVWLSNYFAAKEIRTLSRESLNWLLLSVENIASSIWIILFPLEVLGSSANR